jgi:Family of unknown function (DUF6188)
VTRPGEPRPIIRSRDADGTVTHRTADSAGLAAGTDPRLDEQLSALSGQRLSQYGIAINGVGLSFRGEDIATPSREIFIEQETIQITQPGRQPRPVPSHGELIATTLLSTLNHQLTQARISDGHLHLTFDNDLELAVDPHPHWEAWQISSAEHLLIVCTPGGQLTIRYPDQDT